MLGLFECGLKQACVVVDVCGWEKGGAILGGRDWVGVGSGVEIEKERYGDDERVGR